MAGLQFRLMIQPTRIRILSDQKPTSGKYVLYWMQQSQRVQFNHALEYAIERANELDLPLIVGFGLMDDYPAANVRHYAFMLAGLNDVHRDLSKRGIKFVVRHGMPAEVAVTLARDAAMVVCDRGYLRHQKRWRDHVADHAGKRVVEVESDVVVPVDTTSTKQEFAARTIRPKIHRALESYLVDLPEKEVRRKSLSQPVVSDLDVRKPEAVLQKLKLDRSVPVSKRLVGGSREGRRLMDVFVHSTLSNYATARNEPAAAGTSMMSAYLHFGQISALELALKVKRVYRSPNEDCAAYLEELIVRRELAMNFCHHSPSYDSYDGLPEWAKKTLAEHEKDDRPTIYSDRQLEESRTHDESWNAAQSEMVKTGFMHNYMRMYWGKKILEWSASPREAYERTLRMNNKYFLCGRDAISFASVAWIYGLHDRPWGPARPIFGLIRYMNEAGLHRKFDMDAYIKKVALME